MLSAVWILRYIFFDFVWNSRGINNVLFHFKIVVRAKCHKMNLLITNFLLSIALHSVIGQQCRYITVPVCDGDNASVLRSNMTSKGEKGDRGFSGKVGPSGSKGAGGDKGDKGEMGTKGSTAQVEELQEHLSRRIDGESTTV